MLQMHYLRHHVTVFGKVFPIRVQRLISIKRYQSQARRHSMDLRSAKGFKKGGAQVYNIAIE